jgi:hypothetical protein
VGAGALWLMAGASVLGTLPRLAAHALGFGYRNVFVFKDKTLRRPEHFSSKSHKAVFDKVGSYISDPLRGNIMHSLTDRSLQNTAIRGIPEPPDFDLAVYHEVLKFFEAEGVIIRRWELRLRGADGKNHPRIPDWNCHGERLHRNEFGQLTKTGFCPGLLDDEQKSCLMGSLYPELYADCVGSSKQEWELLGEQSFELVYYRPSEILSDDGFDKAAKRVTKVLQTLTI